MPVSKDVADFAVGLVSGIHYVIAAGEIFLWDRVYPRLKQFNFSPEEAEKVRPIVANAGLYNAFIATGLMLSVMSATGLRPARLFFLVCVAVAGIFGAVTLKAPRTLAFQTLPALIAIALVWLAQS